MLAADGEWTHLVLPFNNLPQQYQTFDRITFYDPADQQVGECRAAAACGVCMWGRCQVRGFPPHLMQPYAVECSQASLWTT